MISPIDGPVHRQATRYQTEVPQKPKFFNMMK